jgi:hypothetical protein
MKSLIFAALLRKPVQLLCVAPALALLCLPVLGSPALLAQDASSVRIAPVIETSPWVAVFYDGGTGPGFKKWGGGGPTISTFTPASGPAGTVVSITGTDLTQTCWLKVSGVYSDGIRVYSNTLVTATVPAGATTGPISITFTEPGGETVFTTTPFVVTP